MTFTDIAIVVIVAVLLGLIIYFSFIKKKDGCANCANRKNCPVKMKNCEKKTEEADKEGNEKRN